MKENKQITIFVIDDDPSVRKALSLLLRSEGYDAEVFDSAESFLKRRRYFGMGCIVLDIRMKAMNGLELQDELNKRKMPLPIVFITGHGDIPTSVKVMQKGAVNFLTKPFEDTEFLSAVDDAIKKSIGTADEMNEKIKIFEQVMELTEREMDILRYVIGGFMNKEISAKLNIAEQTVKIHRGHIMRKLCVDSLADLIRKTEIANIIPEKRH
jgi:FixJ family two-component response regulator